MGPNDRARRVKGDGCARPGGGRGRVGVRAYGMRVVVTGPGRDQRDGSARCQPAQALGEEKAEGAGPQRTMNPQSRAFLQNSQRSEEHTSELQSRENLVC